MAAWREIRADFDRETIVVYQAYRPEIAAAALKAGKFVAPFSFERMTWIKPSFLWLMARSNWGRKRGQECTLAIRIARDGWDRALNLGVLTSYEAGVHSSRENWTAEFDQAKVHVQWDPERSLRGQTLQHRSIQVGLSRHVIREFAESWVCEIIDLSALVKRIRLHSTAGDHARARRLLPREHLYNVPVAVGQRLGMLARQSGNQASESR
jgi:hypothetical protein